MEFRRRFTGGLRDAGKLLIRGDTLRYFPKIILSCILCSWLLMMIGSVSLGIPQEPKVESVEVQLKITGQIYEGLQERIEFSICRVGEKILLSQPLSLLRQNRQTLKSAIYNVFSKVLAGFRIETIDIELQEHTRIQMQLVPEGPFITKVNLKTHFVDISPESAPLFRDTIIKTEEELERIFKGLPTAALPWAESIINMVTQYLVERDFPGFRPMLALQGKSGGIVEFYLQLVPKGQMVKDVRVNYSSMTIPVQMIRSKLGVDPADLDILTGMPVEYLVHYQRDIENYLLTIFDGIPSLRKIGLDADLRLKPDEETEVLVTVNSEHWRTNIETRFFFGDQDYHYIQAYVGYSLKDYEVYTKVFAGEHPSDHVKVGLKIPISTNFYGGFEYQLENHLKNIGLYYQFERGDYLHLRFGLDESPDEAVIGIRINDHFNLEVVHYDRDLGLQFMFHLW